MFSFGVVCAVVDHTADLAAFTEAAIVCAFDHDCGASHATIISCSFVSLHACWWLRLHGLVAGTLPSFTVRGNNTCCGLCVCSECEHDATDVINHRPGEKPAVGLNFLPRFALGRWSGRATATRR